jgi:RimJ/RimL family protein N-acetyltransferase
LGLLVQELVELGQQGCALPDKRTAVPADGRLKPRMSENSSVETFLETERLQLRRFTDDDVENLVELDSDPAVMHFITGGRPTPREEIEHEVVPAFLDHYERYAAYGFWAAIEKATGRFVGWFHLRPAEGAPPGEVELGYRLRRSDWGKAYATEGARALVDKAFAELGVRRVVAHTMVVHVASRRVLEKAGLRFVRVFHQPWPYSIEGEEKGDVEYALIRSEWEQSAAGVSPAAARRTSP